MSSVQAAIDAQDYPPTHLYRVEGLVPRGPLAERVQIILKLCPDFFQATAFLDVGCSKGFFSLRAARESEHVLAIDPDPAALAAWAPICPPNVTQRVGTFGTLAPWKPADMVWIGNGPHYLYREDPAWVKRLASIATDRVVMEGPVGAACRDLDGFGPFQEERALVASMASVGFVLVKRAASPAYTPDRAIWYFRRQFRRRAPKKVRRD